MSLRRLTTVLSLAAAVTAVIPHSLSRAQNEPGEEPGGIRQSPVDIRTEDVIRARLPKLVLSYSTRAALRLVNTGSPDEHASVRADVAPGAGTLKVRGETYRLLQFHWHTPGEHHVDGHETPMEMHLVHQADDGDLLVLGVLIEAGKKHRELQKVFGDLPQDPAAPVEVSGFNLRKLLPSKLLSYRYQGSLTTPGFDEEVTWVVLAKPITLSEAQIDAFEALFPHGNSRDPQPLHGRFIISDVPRRRRAR